MKKTYDLHTSDGLMLHGTHWTAEHPKAVICLVHGLGEYADRYNHFADYFNGKGYAVIAYDRRGHGKSGGTKGHTPSYKAYLDEIDLLIAEAKKQYPNLPMVIYGHSQGGNLVLKYEIERQPDVRAVVASAPWIRLAFEPPKFLVALGKAMRSVYPKFSNKNNLDPNHLSRSPEVVEHYVSDPLVHRSITAGTAMAMMEAAKELDAYRGALPLPTLIMHGGEDKVTSMPASKAFAERVGGDVQFKIWKDFYHEIHNEPERMEVFDYTTTWLESIIRS